MQAPKNFPATQDIQQSSSYGNSKENPTGSVRPTDFCMGACFPFVSDMRHRLLNLSSVRHSINLQFTNRNSLWVGTAASHTKETSSVNGTLVLSDSGDGCLPWDAEERFLWSVFFF